MKDENGIKIIIPKEISQYGGICYYKGKFYAPHTPTNYSSKKYTTVYKHLDLTFGFAINDDDIPMNEDEREKFRDKYLVI